MLFVSRLVTLELFIYNMYIQWINSYYCCSFCFCFSCCFCFCFCL